jgi:hypothetical protein
MTAAVIGLVPVAAVVGVASWFQAWAAVPARDRGRNVAPVSKEGTPCPR